MSRQMQALCCVCGQLRTCFRPRNYRPENNHLRAPVDPNWERETGDLKCQQCGTITRHAIILGGNDYWGGKHAEVLHELGTGWVNNRTTEDERKLMQDRWHQSPQNPRLLHIWWNSDEKAARKAGRSYVYAICKAKVHLCELGEDEAEKPSKDTTSGYNRDQVWAPKFIDSEADKDGWRRISCVDCLALTNRIAINEQREQLKEKLIEYVGKLSSLDPATVVSLVEQFRAAEAE
ncbi:hypothetical protein OS121_13195 [Mycolicibacterium mucogenicum]|uniref:hypothetical protein n=1 Tax=Mycolicibacterium mucogenicum TaxID=56689 RepID=UPI002269884D|nr:hypothetical protein [Mycolicibacterium mucogenicum]MCX8556040.1 hypothetical protein [Mycolicibacterium mucogenicum]